MSSIYLPSITNRAIHQATGRKVPGFAWYNPRGTGKIPQAVNGRTVSEKRSCWWQAIK